MMNNLFSMFDPSNSYFSLVWILISMPVITLPIFTKMKMNNKNEYAWISIKAIMTKEMANLIKPKMPKNTSVVGTYTFMVVMVLNLLAMSSFNFTLSAHITISMPIASSLWMSSIMFCMMNNPNKFMIHLTPKNTPTMLMSFMVIIELMSMIIRPITLSVRLSANMISGHLMMSLISSSSLTNWTSPLFMFIPTFLLTILEMGVSMIQAYVMATLATLYCKENL